MVGGVGWSLSGTEHGRWGGCGRRGEGHTRNTGLRRLRFAAAFGDVPWSVLVQLGRVVAMLVLLGAFGAGFALLLSGGVWC